MLNMPPLSRASPLPHWIGVNSSIPRSTPRLDQLHKPVLHLSDQRFIVDFPGQPGSARFLEDRPPDGKHTAGCALTGLAKTLGQCGGRGVEAQRTEERRVVKEWVSTCRCRGATI